MDLAEVISNMSIEKECVQKKREHYLEWEGYFMAIAMLSAERSKDPHYQVGACIVNEDKQIVGIGYNGMPTGCSDDEFPWGKDKRSPLNSKHMYVCHAEMNAIFNSYAKSLKNCTIYVTLFPCNECTKMIIQSRIKEVVFLSDKDFGKDFNTGSKKMLEATGIKTRQFLPTGQSFVINV